MSKKDVKTDKRIEEFETEARKVVAKVQKTADSLKTKPGADKKNIQRRADRFADGVEALADDLETQRNSTDIHRTITTSPINSKGNYTTADGSLNNYIDRLETHAEQTMDRMREDVTGGK